MKEYLYHYTTTESLTKGICVTNSIRLNEIIKVNDPLDYKDRLVKTKQIIFGNHEEALAHNDRRRSFENLLIERWGRNSKIASFAIDNVEEGIMGYQLANLWTYYAENHQGICLKFEKEKLLNFFDNNFKILKPMHQEVKYQNMIPHVKFEDKYSDDYLLGVIDNKVSLFFSKLKVWDREQEYRLICFSKNKYEFIPIDGFLEEIIFGQQTNKETELLICNKFKNIKYSKMNYFAGDGKFEKMELDNLFWKHISQV
ncbi:DUF2971 domain-containing protein [Saccharicrinis aurantiacus]|uniref:DUF2971 domain-containing protein n=1 Tax=Saccharicrinis aurantiacus TaxID=1849719 RepID=UPI0008384DF9|nr:DUF2971 domain-containing protein [Saccharicrinis aurantiacus]